MLRIRKQYEIKIAKKKKTIRTQKSKRKHNNAIKTLMVVIKENLVKQAVTSSIIFMKSIHDFL